MDTNIEPLMRAYVVASPLTLRGGVAQYWIRAKSNLAASGIELSMVTDVLTNEDVQAPRLKLVPSTFAWYRRVFVPLLKASDASWIVTSIPQSDILHGILGRRQVDLPWICFVHGQPYPLVGQSSTLKRMVWKLLWRYSVKKVDLVVAVSQSAATHIPSGVPVVVLPPLAPELNSNELSDPESKKFVGYVGRMSFEKAPDLFGRIASQDETRTYVAFGDGPLLPSLVESFHDVDWKGNAHSFRDCFESIRILLLTSESEGLPLVILEAAVSGVPPIVADVGSVATAIHPKNRNLLLVPKENRQDIEGWMSRMEELEDSEVYDRVVRLQREWIDLHFNSAATTGRLLQAFRSVLS